ncbi:unnamed protein product [Ixodes hexagonus]
MRNWDPRDTDSRCDLDADEADAKWVCDALGIPFRTVDFVKPYWHNVFSPMLQEYQDGLTPNPDIVCNRVIKFGAFHRHATERLGADAVATGHYARIRSLPDGSVELLRGVDPVKDQSFFLSQVGQAALRRTLFPLGETTKEQVKATARSLGLHRVASKKESMGMCFVGKQDFQSFVGKYVEPKRGTFVDIETGQVVGTHSGVHNWTLGQRCHLGGLRSAYFVAKLCPVTQQILVAPGTDHPSLYWRLVHTGPPHWIRQPLVGERSPPSVACLFKSQHREAPVPCTLSQGPTNGLTVTLDAHKRAISPGQFAVFYGEDSQCFGSAKITELGPSLYEEQLSSHSTVRSRG